MPFFLMSFKFHCKELVLDLHIGKGQAPTTDVYAESLMWGLWTAPVGSEGSGGVRAWCWGKGCLLGVFMWHPLGCEEASGPFATGTWGSPGCRVFRFLPHSDILAQACSGFPCKTVQPGALWMWRLTAKGCTLLRDCSLPICRSASEQKPCCQRLSVKTFNPACAL